MRKQRIILTPLLKDSWRLVSNMIGQRTISFADYENILGQAALEKGVRANFLKENFQKAGLITVKGNEVHLDSDAVEDSIVGLSLLKSAGPAQRFSETQGQTLLDWLWQAERMGFSFSQATFNWNIEERLKRTTIEPMPILRVSEPEQIAAGFASEKQNDDYRRYLAVAGILPVHFPDRDIVMQKLAADPQLISFLGFFADMASKLEVLWIYLREIGFDWSFAYLRKVVQGIPSHLRRYLGSYTLSGRRSYPTLQWGFSLPEGLNPVKVKNLIKEELENDILPLFMEDKTLGFAQMTQMIQEGENDILLEILKELKQEFEQIDSFLVVPGFQDKVAGWPKSLPDFLEKVVISRVLKEKRLVVALDPGLGKTVIGWALAAIISGTVLILVPADLVRDWLAKGSHYFQKFPRDVLVVSSVGSRVSLKLQEEIKKARVVIATPGLIINRQDHNAEPLSDFGKILVEKQFQALLVDEAHEYRSLKTKSSQALLAIERQMDGLEIVALLTATPHHREPADAAILAALCLPQEFSNPRAYEAVLRSSPEEARLGFIKKKVIFGDVNRLGKLPAVDWSEFDRPRLLELNPAHQAVYDYGLGLKGMSGGVKIHLLRQVALNPNLIKDEQGLGKGITLEDKQGRTRKSLRFPMSQAQIKKEISEALEIYQESESDFSGFTANWLCEAGFENLYLASFLNYRSWEEMLAECGSQEAKTTVDLKPVVSSKYEEIVCLARQALVEEKGVVVAGAFLRKGFIERSEDLAEADEVDFRVYTSLVSLLEREFGPIVLAIDGEESLAIRRRMREQWHSNPKWKICVITGRSSGRGIELSVSPEKGIKGIIFVIVDLPYVPGATKQLLTRVIRPGQPVPVKIMLLEFPGLIDEGVRLHNQALQEIVDLMNRGLELTGDDRAIVAKPHLGVLTKFMDSPGAQALTYYYNSMRMNSSSDNHRFLNKGEVIKNGKKVSLGFIPGEYLAEIQVRHQKTGLPKLVAQFRREILEQFLFRTAKVLNVGCGALVLESIAGSSFQFTSLDLCQAILSKDKEVLAGLEPPSLVQADTVRLPFKETSFDAVAADFVLDTVRLEDRLLTIQGIHNVIKPGGYFLFSLTVKGTMKPEHFQSWVIGLQEMGWEVMKDFSGLAEGRLENGRPLVNFWSFVCQKNGNQTKNVNPCLFRLLFEETGRELLDGKLTDEEKILVSEDWRYRKADEMVILDICQNTVKARLKLRKEV